MGTSMTQDELLVSFSPNGLSGLRCHLPEAAILAKTLEAWLPLALSDLERPPNTRVDVSLARVDIKREGSRVVSPPHKDAFVLSSFFGDLADEADVALNKAGKRADSALKKAGEHADSAITKAGEGVQLALSAAG